MSHTSQHSTRQETKTTTKGSSANTLICFPFSEHVSDLKNPKTENHIIHHKHYFT